MPLVLSQELDGRLRLVDDELRPAAEAVGLAALPHLERLRPRLLDLAPGVEAVLEELDLEREGGPDPLSLAGCVAAHGAYARRRGRPDAISPGALALARILVWGERAAMLGRAPRIRWIGPPGRAPEAAPEDVRVSATCRIAIGEGSRRAAALAFARPPEGG